MNLKQPHSKGFVQTTSTPGTRGGKAVVQNPVAKPHSSPTYMPKAKNESQRLGILEDRGQR